MATDPFHAFRRKKPGPLRGKSEAAGKKAKAEAPVAGPTAEQLIEYEGRLRQFDMNYKFGPCRDMTRIERWRRAEALGLNPPEEIRELLEKLGPSSPLTTNCFDAPDPN